MTPPVLTSGTQTPTLLELIFALLKEMVWPAFWLIVVIAWKRQITDFLRAIISLLNRAISLKFGPFEAIIPLPPEEPGSLTWGITERDL